MLIPTIFNPNSEQALGKISPDGQKLADLMGKQSEGDDTSGVPLKQSSYASLHQRTSLTLAIESTGSPTSSTKGSHCGADEDCELTPSDGDHFASIHDEDERQACALKRRFKSQGDEIGLKLKQELSKYKQELKEYNETTKSLEKKYMKINHELTEMQQKHEQFADRGDMELANEADVELNTLQGYSPSNTSLQSVEITQSTIKKFHSDTSFLTVMAVSSSPEELSAKQKRQKQRSTKTKHNLSGQVDPLYREPHRDPLVSRQGKEAPSSIKQMYHVLQEVVNMKQEFKNKYNYDRDSGEVIKLYSTIKDLKNEQTQYRNIIRHQQDCITDYHSRCVKAQEIMKTQKHEIDKLHVNNKQLESSIYHDIDLLRSKIDNKLKSVAQLPHLMREEHVKFEKVLREKCLMAEKLHTLQKEASQLKAKIDELGKRKMVTVNRLKAAERDLKIFKNYNTALKTEKQRMSDELSSMKLQLDTLQAASKRQLTRHREQTEKQRRELQKRIIDLELKLSRSQNSTSSLIQERDSLIAELQTQLHTLVHNFEVSQKHIRVLRRHIYSMTSGGLPNNALGSNPSPSAGGGNNTGNATGSGNANGAVITFHRTVCSEPGDSRIGQPAQSTNTGGNSWQGGARVLKPRS